MTADSQPAGSPVAPIHGSARGPSAAIVLLLVAAAVVGGVVVAALSTTALPPAPRPSGVAVASPAASPSSAPSASPASSPVAGPSASPIDGRTILVLRGLADPAGALANLAACSPVMRVTGEASPAIKGSDVDAAVVAAGREDGWVFVPPGVQALTRVWLGDDVVELARAAGRPVVAVGTDGAVWLGGAAGAARWRPIPTPAGRTAWVLTANEVTSRGRCGPWPVPQSIAGQRAITCAGVDGPVCLQAVARLGADQPGVLYPGGDLALARPTCPARSAACLDGELTAVGAPAGWAGSVVGVEAATLDLPDGAFRLMAPGAEPEYALDALSPPSLPLPTSAVRPSACSATLTGDLHAAAWDPRVFWVGSSAVVWRAGATARFTDLPALTVPTAAGSYHFPAGALVRLAGSVDPRTHKFVACSAVPMSQAGRR